MAGSDAILVGEDWISEHYFTTDATRESFQAQVLARRKAWEAEKDVGTVRTRFTAQRTDLLTRFADLTPGQGAHDLHKLIIDLLGYTGVGYHHDVSGPVTGISPPGLEVSRGLVVIEAVACETIEDLLVKDNPTLAEAYEPDEQDSYTSVHRALSALFVADDHPDFALVLGGRIALVAERERWAEGRYLAVDLQVVCERNDDKRGGEVDRALSCLSAECLAPDAEGDIWWRGVLEESIKHTVGVSEDLRDGVRLSIEIIANEVVTRRRELGREPLEPDQAQPLAKQSLRFLYRILFLLFAEASPELGVLPTGAPEYERGYSLDRLRELTLVELTSSRARSGTHLYESLAVLFRLIDHGHDPRPATEADHSELGHSGEHAGLEFRSLRADLFRPEATELINAVGLGNLALQQVLQHLLLSKERSGKDRGFISYAELGINQLGAVYEGLMSYTGIFATEDLYEVAKGADASKGSWVVPVHRAEGIAATDFVRTEDPLTGELRPVLHPKGGFVFRLAGRERQQSASYYTPEVLTRFVVSQSLAELLDQDGHTTTSEEILGLSVCEPALGSGAFAIEAVRQLAGEYLTRRQDELGERIDPDAYPRELQRVKAFLALHRVHGVDLNATAVELAEISLWLDTMVEGLSAPWFGLHLRRGNSLIGARRAVYTRDQVSRKTWLTTVPAEVPMAGMPADVAAESDGAAAGRIHHFLLPATGWGSAVEAKEAKNLAPEALDRLKTWRKGLKAKPTAKQVKELVELGHRVERLWQIAWRRLEIAESEIRRAIPLWGRDTPPAGGAVTREQIESSLADAEGAYQRLRRGTAAGTPPWFWPLTDALTTVDGHDGPVQPPSLSEWIDACQQLLGRDPDVSKASRQHQRSLGSAGSWAELGQAEQDDLGFAQARTVEKVLHDHPWLVVCERVARQQGFFHWELDFAPVFAAGGFDLQVGNPPWVRPRSDVAALLAEGDPWWQLAVKPTQAQVAERRTETLARPGMQRLVVEGTVEIACLAAFVGDRLEYPHLAGLQPDLYRCFMEQTWRLQSMAGVIGLVHLESHFTDEKAGHLRAATYSRMRRHWQFINELELFEIQNQKTYGIHVYGRSVSNPDFLMATSLYHPDTVSRSLDHNGLGEEPGLKDADGRWDLRPHRNRIIRVTHETLQTWHAVLEDPEVPVQQTRMVYAVNQATAAVLAKLATAPRLGELELEFSRGWDESIDRTRGYFETRWGRPDSWRDVILQGSHLFVATPMYKMPNSTLRNQRDWSETDFEQLPPDAIPVTAYKPTEDRVRYDKGYTHWGDEGEIPARDHYRVAWRNMAANTGERTLTPAIIPPGAAHVHTVLSAGTGASSASGTASLAAVLSSLVSDFMIRVTPKGHIHASSVARLPTPSGNVNTSIVLRVLRLNCLSSAYAELWDSCFEESFMGDEWACARTEVRLGDIMGQWNPSTPLKVAADRRQAQIEIDSLVAVGLGLDADELCTIYRTQFPVLYGYDRNTYYYDRNGRLVPQSVRAVWKQKGEGISEEERTATNQAGHTYTYELPFVTLDREADMRQAYAHFEQKLAERS